MEDLARSIRNFRSSFFDFCRPDAAGWPVALGSASHHCLASRLLSVDCKDVLWETARPRIGTA